MAIFQFSNFQLNYQLHLHLVSRDTLLVYRSDQMKPWENFISFWKSKVDVAKTGKLCVLMLPAQSEQNANYDPTGELRAVESLLDAVGFEDVVLMGQTSAGYLGMELEGRVKKMVVLDPTPYQWENRSPQASKKESANEVLVLQGAFDKAHPKTGVREFVKSLPNARVLEMNDSSNDAIYNEINSFI